jgi:hypothetical protein
MEKMAKARNAKPEIRNERNDGYNKELHKLQRTTNEIQSKVNRRRPAGRGERYCSDSSSSVLGSDSLQRFHYRCQLQGCLIHQHISPDARPLPQRPLGYGDQNSVMAKSPESLSSAGQILWRPKANYFQKHLRTVFVAEGKIGNKGFLAIMENLTFTN